MGLLTKHWINGTVHTCNVAAAVGCGSYRLVDSPLLICRGGQNCSAKLWKSADGIHPLKATALTRLSRCVLTSSRRRGASARPDQGQEAQGHVRVGGILPVSQIQGEGQPEGQPADCNQVMHEQGAGLDAAPGTGLLDGVAVRLRCATAPQLSCTIPGMPRILECLDGCFCIVTVGFD